MHIKEGDHVRIVSGAATVPERWWGRSAVVVDVEDSPANKAIGIQAQIKFSEGGLEPIVPLACLEAA